MMRGETLTGNSHTRDPALTGQAMNPLRRKKIQGFGPVAQLVRAADS